MNDAILIDTDVFSYWLKGDTRGRLYTPDASGKTLCLSFMSVAEIKRWALSRGWGVARRSSLAAALSRYVVVPFDEPMADAWAEIGDHRARLGRPIDTGDCWIAATAVRHGLALVTHNARHYREIPALRIITKHIDPGGR